MFRIENDLCPKPLVNLFQARDNANYSLWRSVSQIPCNQTTKFNNSFMCKSVIEWLRLPTQLKASRNIKQFTRKYKISVIDKY